MKKFFIITFLFFLQLCNFPRCDGGGLVSKFAGMQNHPPKPKLRVLIIVVVTPYMWTHYNWHKEMAKILAKDGENVEFVKLLALTMNDFEGVEEESKAVKKLNNEMLNIELLTMPSKHYELANPWLKSTNFEPQPKPVTSFNGILKNDELLMRLHNLHFNVGMVETFTAAPLAIFEMLPTIQKTIATISFFPNNNFYEHLGFSAMNKFIPETLNAEIDDHLLIGKNDEELYKIAEHEHREIENKENKHEIFYELKRRQQEIVRKNKMFLDTREQQELETWKVYNPIIIQYMQKHHHAHLHYAECPSLKQLFQKIAYFVVNSQPQFGFPLQEKLLTEYEKTVKGLSAEKEFDLRWAMANEIGNPEAEMLREKLRFVGGIALPESGGTLDQITEDILNAKATKLNRTPCQRLLQPKGTILVSFGTAVKMPLMPLEKWGGFREAFHELAANGYQFIWKDTDRTKAMNAQATRYKCYGNIFTSDWLPQSEILAHPNTKLFISHCGNNSMIESLHAKVPMVCFPFFGDQMFNAEAMASRGWAKVLNIRENDAEKLKVQLVKAMLEMLGESEKLPDMKIKSKAEVTNDFLANMADLRNELV